MAHGFAGVRDARLAAYAERFAAAGLACLVFDYRYFGESGGAPRQLLDVGAQLADWRAALSLARSHPQVDPRRVALWGTSLSGGHVIDVAAADPGIAAVVAQAPYVGGRARGRSPYTKAQRRGLGRAVLRDLLHAATRRSPVEVPVVGPPGSVAVLASPDAERGYLAIAPPSWPNRVAARGLLGLARYRPGRRAGAVRAPLLVTVQTADALTPPEAARRVAQRAPRGKLREYPGGHFDVYVGEGFERAVSEQADFLAFYLLRKPTEAAAAVS